MEELLNDCNKIREEFMSKYNEEHKYCPNCGSEDYMTTLVGYMFHCDNPDSYKDLNKCHCMSCNDQHTYHERISTKIIKK